MFIAVYEFEIKPGTENRFRQAWLEVTKAIYAKCGSFGSRLHTSDKPNTFVGYAQWESQQAWEKDHQLTDELYLRARNEMRDCLVKSTQCTSLKFVMTIYKQR
ncbi:hypothetical protein JCM19238_1705 [Vibrio ponticus]|nr:hypothetical protein JCM19238_1705 [Vibrio ponticus]